VTLSMSGRKQTNEEDGLLQEGGGPDPKKRNVPPAALEAASKAKVGAARKKICKTYLGGFRAACKRSPVETGKTRTISVDGTRGEIASGLVREKTPHTPRGHLHKRTTRKKNVKWEPREGKKRSEPCGTTELYRIRRKDSDVSGREKEKNRLADNDEVSRAREKFEGGGTTPQGWQVLPREKSRRGPNSRVPGTAPGEKKCEEGGKW